MWGSCMNTSWQSLRRRYLSVGQVPLSRRLPKLLRVSVGTGWDQWGNLRSGWMCSTLLEAFYASVLIRHLIPISPTSLLSMTSFRLLSSLSSFQVLRSCLTWSMCTIHAPFMHGRTCRRVPSMRMYHSCMGASQIPSAPVHAHLAA